MPLKYNVKSFPGSFPDNHLEQRITNFLQECPTNLDGKLCDNEQGDYHVVLIDADQVEPRTFAEFFSRGTVYEGLMKEINLADQGIFLFLSQSSSYTSWSSDNDTLKQNQFYIRLCLSYGLGQFITYVPQKDALPLTDENRDLSGELITRLGRLWMRCSGQHRHVRDSDSLGAIFDHIKDDIENLRGLTRKELMKTRIETLDFKQSFCETEDFLRDLAAIYQLGRRPQKEAEEVVEKEIGWLREYGGSYKLKREIDTKLRELNTGSTPAEELHETLTALQARLRSYKVLRDISMWLASGATYRSKLKQHIRVLIIDETLLSNENDGLGKNLKKDLKEKLDNILDVFRNRGAISFDYIFTEAENGSTEPHIWPSLEEYLQGKIKKSNKFNFAKLKSSKLCELREVQRRDSEAAEPEQVEIDDSPQISDVGEIYDYNLILVEVEFRGEYMGPKIVEKLTKYLDDNKDKYTYRPNIVVLSYAENFGHIQQCLNLGAELYILKNRIYELPGRVAKARIMRGEAEPRGRRSNFRSLYKMPPRMIAKLQSEEEQDLIHGYPWDWLDRKWISRLPKTDLHHHIGTSVGLKAIEAMAYNSCGYLLPLDKGLRAAHEAALPESTKQDSILRDLKRDVLLPLCQLVILASIFHRSFGEAKERGEESPYYHPSKSFEVAAHCLLPTPDEQGKTNRDAKDSDSKKEKGNVYRRIIDHLTPPHRQASSFEVSSLLVAAICLLSDMARGLRPWEDVAAHQWSYLQRVTDWHGDETQEGWIDELKQRTAKMCKKITVEGWRRALTSWQAANNFVQTVNPVDGEPESPFALCHKWIEIRTLYTQRLLETTFEEALRSLNNDENKQKIKKALEALKEQNIFDGRRDFLHRDYKSLTDQIKKKETQEEKKRDSDKRHGTVRDQGPTSFLPEFISTGNYLQPPSLSELVKIPQETSPSEKNLLRYLLGTELLGAEHLQYPENILLAGQDIIKQAVKENIVYSEIRCQTTGYSSGGMSDVDATDLLCLSFDLAAAYYATRKPPDHTAKQPTETDFDLPPRWVRINVLLGAKRHKSDAEFQQIVSLLTYYLQRGETFETGLQPIHPVWWKPCRVVGFDLSGDESKQNPNFKSLIEPVFKYCAPITIHAGEAATAESIWNAVYHLGARRIGHGLRLREDKRLLDYCITEGICMELCPTSNQFTNGFEGVPNRDEYYGPRCENYPLRYYMEQGLDVCINTDNRQLHALSTLTDDYMCAARLIGGLTKWEILKLVKSGFKHAFLPKRQIEAMLQTFEHEVYLLISEEAQKQK